MQELGLTPAQARPAPEQEEEERADDEAELEEQAA
ncbi:MAG: hypothetical protein KatS3mg082_1954 [Nitrospiraceae bacterium]|nr:MAG: hypothetical protein KatS3mg082_1954 [Nitrospiraceae bacterium]